MINILYWIKQRIIPGVRIVRSCAFWYAAFSWYQQRENNKLWLRNGRAGSPPSRFKQAVVKDYADRFAFTCFIETGTFMGDMIYAVRDIFSEIYTIELSADFYRDAKKRFKRNSHIHLIQGDSGNELGKVLANIDTPCLFWLDGHYSGGRTAKGELEAPIEKELSVIANHSQAQRHVILIDDARCFTGKGGYPTLDRLEEWVKRCGYDQFEVRDDIIRVFKTV
jgi:hypothetical protein